MVESSLYRLTREDIPRAVECLKDAFQDDPLWEKVFKDDPNRDGALTGFYTCPLLYGMRYGRAYAISPDLEGVAVWVPGNYSHMTLWGMLRSGALAYGMKMGRESARNLGIVNKQLGPARKRLMRNKPYLYVMIIGVSSAAQGKGFGSKIMDAIEQEASREGLHIYLETEKEENITFYQKQGYRVLEKVDLPKINLPMWLMERQP